MGELFNREVELNAGGILLSSRSPDEGISRPTLRTQFKVVRSLGKEPNSGEVSIYNLNKEHRSALQTKNTPTTLEAGYIDNISQIFSGNLQFGSSVKNGLDWITTIQSGDTGGAKYKSARINTSLKGPVSMGKVLRAAGDALGLNLGNIPEKVSQGSLRATLQEMTEGVVLSGKSIDVFTKIAKQMGYSWSIQDGQPQLLGPNESISAGDAVVLTASDGLSTGLIGSPEAGEDGIVKARSLLQPDLVPGRRVQIISREVDGFFRVDKVTFTGDTWGGDWYSDIEAKPL